MRERRACVEAPVVGGAWMSQPYPCSSSGIRDRELALFTGRRVIHPGGIVAASQHAFRHGISLDVSATAAPGLRRTRGTGRLADAIPRRHLRRTRNAGLASDARSAPGLVLLGWHSFPSRRDGGGDGHRGRWRSSRAERLRWLWWQRSRGHGCRHLPGRMRDRRSGADAWGTADAAISFSNRLPDRRLHLSGQFHSPDHGPPKILILG